MKVSEFDGGLFELLIISMGGAIITAVTLGICYPWALCMVYGWKINHTIIDGKRLRFNGKAMSLLGSWIKWFLLSIVTLGVYSFWVGIKLEQWKVRNTTLDS